MYYGNIKPLDPSNGTGVRVCLFVSGCRRHCKDCFNSETWNFQYGQPFTQDTVDEILRDLEPAYVQGLTVLGGEPMEPENQPVVLDLLRQVHEKFPQKNIWLFSGYPLDEYIWAKKLGPWEVTQELLSYVDVLVDGPFISEQKDVSLRFRGSRNQRIIDMKKSNEAGEIVLWSDWQDRR